MTTSIPLHFLALLSAKLLCHNFWRLARYFFVFAAYSAPHEACLFIGTPEKLRKCTLAHRRTMRRNAQESGSFFCCPAGATFIRAFTVARWRRGRTIDEARDERELALVDNFLREGKPVVGICRGLQVLNVYFGGTLRQHIEGHSQIDGVDRRMPSTPHRDLLRALYGTRFTVNSAHHQAVETAWARGCKSCLRERRHGRGDRA